MARDLVPDARTPANVALADLAAQAAAVAHRRGRRRPSPPVACRPVGTPGVGRRTRSVARRDPEEATGAPAATPPGDADPGARSAP